MSFITFSNGMKVEFQGTPTQKEVERVAFNLGIAEPTTRQKFDERLMGTFQSLIKAPTGAMRVLNTVRAGLNPFRTLEDYSARAGKIADMTGIETRQFYPGTKQAKDFNAKFTTPQNKYQAQGQLAGDIGQFFLSAPLTGVSNAQRLAIAPLLDTALQVSQDVGGGQADKNEILRNAMLTAGTSIMAGVFMPVKNVNWAKMSASGALTGYVSDVATGLSGMRGEDREGLKSFIPGAGTAFGTAIGVGTGGMVRFSKAGRQEKIVDNRIKSLQQLEHNYPKVKTAFDNAREQGYDPINILAYTDALNGSTDAGGKISMGKALNRLDLEMEPMEPHIYNILKEEGTTITLPQFKKGLVEMLQTSRLQMDERVALQNKIKKLIEVGKEIAKQNGGVIPLYKLQARKTSLGAQIRTQYGTVKGSTNKEVVRAYKEIIEKNTPNVDVQAYNQILQQLYTFKSVLKSLDNKIIEGGRLGRWTQTLLGSYVGGQIGGPVGSALGAEIGYRGRSATNKRHFGEQKTPFIKKGAYAIAKNATTRQEKISGPRKKSQTKNITKDKNAIENSVPQKKGLIATAKDKVKGAIKAYKDLPPSTRSGGFAKLPGVEGESGRAKSERALQERKLASSNDTRSDLNVNEKMQIIDETKTGADALVGTVGNLSPELRTAVIRAVKSRDQVTLNKLVPQIAEELRVKAERQSQATQLTPEQMAQNRLAKTQERLSEFKRDTKTLDIGLSPVEGTKRTRWSEAHDEAMALFNSGDVDGAYQKFGQIHKEVVTFVKKRLAGTPFEKDVTFKDVSFGVFEGSPEINIGMTAKIKDADMEMFHQFLIDISQRDLYQKSVLTYKHAPHSPELPYGWIDEAKGITRDPLWSFFPTEPLTLPRVKLFNEALAEAGLQFMSLKDGGKRVDILDLKAYNGNYEQFVTKISDLKESLDRKGLTGSSELYGTETRLIGNSPGSSNITYGRSKRDFLKNNPTSLRRDEKIDSPVLDALRYRTSMPKSEFQNLLNTANISPVEKMVYEDIIKKYPDTALINPRSLYKLLEKKTLKVGPGGEMSSYSGYGWSRLFNDSDNYELKTQKIDTNLQKSVDRVTHVSSGDVAQFGHFRYAVRQLKEKMKEVFFGETQNDPFQQSQKFERVTDIVRENGADELGTLKENLRRHQKNLKDYQDIIKTSKKNIQDANTGNTLNHRVVREGDDFLRQIDEMLFERGLQATDTNANKYTWIDEITPEESEGSRGYRVKLSWWDGDVPNHDFVFIRAVGQENELTNGMTRRVDIHSIADDRRTTQNLEDLINNKRASLASSDQKLREDSARELADATRSLQKTQLFIKQTNEKIKKLQKGNKSSVDLLGEQYLNFKRNDIFVKRQLQEQIDFALKSEKPKRIYLPTPSTVAKIEGYFPTPTKKETPTYSYDGSFGTGARRILTGEEVQVNNTPHVVLRSWEDQFQSLPVNAQNRIFLPKGAIKRNRFIREAYVSNMLERVKSDLLQYTTSDRMQEFARNLTLDTKITKSEMRGELYANTRGPVDRPFRGSRDSSGFEEFWAQDPTLREVLERYAKKWKDDESVLNVAFASSPSHNILYDKEANMVVNYDTQKLERHKQPEFLEQPSPDDGLSFESKFDASKDVINENMSDDSNRAVILHRFDDIKKVYPELEEQFNQKLTPYVDENENTWLYFTPQYNEPQWKNIKKTTF